MITIFHGDNILDSRQNLSRYLDKNHPELLRIDSKLININQINLFLNSRSLLNLPKSLLINNFFSTGKPIIDQLIPLFNSTENEIIIWQDKGLTASQLKLFPKAQVFNYPLDNQIFTCLNQIKPHNLTQFLPLFSKNIDNGLVDLMLFLIKSNLRKQLSGYTRFDVSQLKKTYLKLIEIDFLNKSGRLGVPLSVALEKVLVDFLR